MLSVFRTLQCYRHLDLGMKQSVRICSARPFKSFKGFRGPMRSCRIRQVCGHPTQGDFQAGCSQGMQIDVANLSQVGYRSLISVTCSHHEQASPRDASRRQAMQFAVLALLAQQTTPAWGTERRGISRYIKKKALDPLET